MIRRTFRDILDMHGFNAGQELAKLIKMFEEESVVYVRGKGNLSFYECITDTWFRHFPNRRYYTSLDEIKREMNTTANLLRYDNMYRLLLYCEFVKFVIEECIKSMEYATFSMRDTASILEEQMERILDASDYQWLCLKDGSWIVVEKNPVATEAAEIVLDETEAIRILEYNHFTLKGDIEGKKAILKALGNVVEPIIKSKKWIESAYKQIGSDAGFLLNNFNIRHNNMDGANKKEYLSTITPEELEQWYDKIYDCVLAVIILNEQIQTSAEIKTIKELMVK